MYKLAKNLHTYTLIKCCLAFLAFICFGDNALCAENTATSSNVVQQQDVDNKIEQWRATGDCTPEKMKTMPAKDLVSKCLNPMAEIVDTQSKVDEAQKKYDQAVANEQSFANRMLGGLTIAATGIGGMQLAQGIAEKKADDAADADMRAYIEGMRCTYGDGKTVKFGTEPVELPGANVPELMQYRTEYITLAENLKERKEALGLKPGIEAEEILDKATMGLYDDENTGITGGHYASRYRAAAGNEEDEKGLKADKKEAKNRMIAGGVIAGAGLIGGIVGNAIINKDQGKTDDNVKKKCDSFGGKYLGDNDCAVAVSESVKYADINRVIKSKFDKNCTDSVWGLKDGAEYWSSGCNGINLLVFFNSVVCPSKQKYDNGSCIAETASDNNNYNRGGATLPNKQEDVIPGGASDNQGGSDDSNKSNGENDNSDDKNGDAAPEQPKKQVVPDKKNPKKKQPDAKSQPVKQDNKEPAKEPEPVKGASKDSGNKSGDKGQKNISTLFQDVQTPSVDVAKRLINFVLKKDYKRCSTVKGDSVFQDYLECDEDGNIYEFDDVSNSDTFTVSEASILKFLCKSKGNQYKSNVLVLLNHAGECDQDDREIKKFIKEKILNEQ